jgi:hypothetical protein
VICVSAFELQHHLRQLQAERAQAWFAGHVSDAVYMADLDEEIAATSVAYLGAVVTEIAVLRAELSEQRRQG